MPTWTTWNRVVASRSPSQSPTIGCSHRSPAKAIGMPMSMARQERSWRPLGGESVSATRADPPARHGGGRRPGAGRVAHAVRAAVPSQARREASGWPHDAVGRSPSRRRPCSAESATSCSCSAASTTRSRRLGGVRARCRLELRGHGPVRVAATARVALRPADGPGGVRVVPRAALRGRLAARVHARHRRQRALGPGLRPPAAELPDRQAADAGAPPARGGELRAGPARARSRHCSSATPRRSSPTAAAAARATCCSSPATRA